MSYEINPESASDNAPKIGVFEYSYLLMLLLYAGRSINFFNIMQVVDNPIGALIPVIFSAIIAFKWKIEFSVTFYLLLFFFALYFVAVSIKFYVVQPTFLITYYFFFFTTYVAVKSLRFNVFILFEQILFIFAAISLFFWSLEVALGGDSLYAIFSRFAFQPPVSNVSGNGMSAIFYTIQSYETNLINNATIARNCGFAWEPGSFAVYLCIGVFVNLFISEKSKYSKIRFWVLFLAIVTTQSTTGYVILMLISLLYLFNKDMKKVLLMLPVIILAFTAVSSLPFMKEKIIGLIGETENLDDLLYMSYGRETSVTPQRFTSLIITWKDFVDNPILGLAAHYEEQWTYKIGSKISAISGIGNLMAQFGIVGTLFFFVYGIKSSIVFSRHFKYRGTLLLFLMLFGVTISYSVVFMPLVMCFWMFALFENNKNEEPIKPSTGSSVSNSVTGNQFNNITHGIYPDN
jgi:hypothetical protein